ncbi:hypothetical protein [Cryobacterium sp. GrIS_2_6]|uniref:hypothetical protein n=1 Tax=Cryobacterium sp. GrIS_2_6 TaxID=3162785 RepID=UPI002E0C759B|nr:S-formylglutathione hydrolase FrmB [Cryobacterium psychrotolerans]
MIDISGESFPGSDIQGEVLQYAFGGDQAAYDVQHPINLLSGRQYSDDVAIFTAGSDDPGILAGQRDVAAAAQRAGMAVTVREIPNGGHSVRALDGGLDVGFDVLYPRFGLSAP